MSGGGFDASEFIAGFIIEAEEHLTSASAHLLAIEPAAAKGQPTPRQVRELFRSLHTIKGLAAMVAVEPIVEIAHAMEAVLREADRAAGQLPAGSVELLLNGVRAIEQRVRALAKKKTVPAAPAPLVAALNRLRGTGDRATSSAKTSLAPELWGKLGAAEQEQLVQGLRAGRRAVVLRFLPTPELAARGTTITTVRERLSKVVEIVKVVPQSVAVTAAAPGGLAFALILLADGDADGPLTEAAGVEAEALTPVVLEVAPADGADDPGGPADDELADGDSRQRGIVRVDVGRLDEALERLSALVVTQFRLARAAAELRGKGTDVRALAQVIAENGRQLRDLRASIMRARMVSVAELLERVPLIVRALSRATGKEARIELATGRAELDKAVAERIFPAVVHLVRNAVDHGLETAAERVAAGKPPVGTISVSCFERSDNQLELLVADDGRGIDPAAVARRAGVPVPAGNDALLDLLTRPGFSTKTEVTTTSGRGMGMDVVKRITVDELRGELALSTELGRGATFSLRLPLSITIIDAFSFLCGGETFVVPVAMVEEIQEVDLTQTVRGPDRRKAPRGGPDRRRATRAVDMIQRRGEAVPILRLGDLFGLPEEAGGSRKAIVVRRNGDPFAFAVDKMVGQQEIVVRPLEDELVRIDGITGTTDLGDGRPTLVLDLAALGGKLLVEPAAPAPEVGG
jgi:two-component system, chemotaxis family, sensor kinase CheA